MLKRRTVHLATALVASIASLCGCISDKEDNHFVAGGLSPVLMYPTIDSVSVWSHQPTAKDALRVKFGRGKQLSLRASDLEDREFPLIELKGLKAGEEFSYRLAGSGKPGRTHVASLPAKERLRFAVWGDNQEGYDIFGTSTVPLLLELDPDFLVNTGDLVADGNILRDWYHDLYIPAGDLFAKIPWLPVRGNHDGDTSLVGKILPSPGGGDGWYLHRISDAAFLVLNTSVPYAPGSEQFTWLGTALDSPVWKRAAHRFAVFHHPPYTNYWHEEGYQGETGVRDSLIPKLLEEGVDVLLNGHAHIYQRGYLQDERGNRMLTVITGGGGGDLDTIRVANWSHVDVALFKHHVVLVESHGGGLKLQAIDLEGNLLDEVICCFNDKMRPQSLSE